MQTKRRWWGDQELQSKEDVDEAMANLNLQASHMAGNVPIVTVKTEPGAGSCTDGGTKATPQQSAHDIQVMKTLTVLKSDPKKALRNLGETITSAKEIFEATQKGKCTQEVNAGLTKLIPKLSGLHKKVEHVVLQKVEDEVMLTAIATSLVEKFQEFNDVSDWCDKLMPKPGKKMRKS